MDARHFESTLGDLAAILGDPTRRGIYMSISESASPPTATVIAHSGGPPKTIPRSSARSIRESSRA